MKLIISLLCENPWKKIDLSFNYDKTDGYFTWGPLFIYDISLSSSWNVKCSRQSCRQNRRKTSVFSIGFQRRAIYRECGRICGIRKFKEKNVHFHILSWIINVKTTNLEYAVIISSPQQQWLRDFSAQLNCM